MPLKAVLTKEEFEAADAAVKGLYKPIQGNKEGLAILDVQPVQGFTLENVEGLKSTLGRHKEELRQLQESGKAFEGLDPGKAREALAKVEEMASWTPEQKVKEQLEANRQQLIGIHQGELGKVNKKLEAREAQLREALVRSVALDAIRAANGSVELLLPHVERRMRVREGQDGRLIAEVLDAAGNPAVGDASGAPMTVQGLVKEFAGSAVFAPAFQTPPKGGSGAQPGSPPRSGGGPSGRFSMSAETARDNPSAYLKMRAEAQKVGESVQLTE